MGNFRNKCILRILSGCYSFEKGKLVLSIPKDGFSMVTEVKNEKIYKRRL
jgi:hypothetical protein